MTDDACGRRSDHRPRILLVSANYHPSVGGVKRFVETLAEGLVARGLNVTVLCCRHGAAQLTEESGGVRVVRLPSTHVLYRRLNVPYPLPSPLALGSSLRTLGGWADVVH